MMQGRMRRVVLVWGVLLLGAAQVYGGEMGRMVLSPESECPGKELRTQKDLSLEECQKACLSDPDCKAFTYEEETRSCFLQSTAPPLKKAPGRTAGVVVQEREPASALSRQPMEPDLGKAPTLAFVPAYVREEAFQEARAARVRGSQEGGPDLETLQEAGRTAQGTGDARLAAQHFRDAIAWDSSDPRLWLELARCLLAIRTSDGREAYEIPREATSAALMAHSLSTAASVRAESLAILAQALERRDLFRPALEAYKASLAIISSPSVRQAFLDLRARRGFRVIEHTVDADTATPRVCIQFSDELLQAGVDYSSFVTLEGRPAPALGLEEREICVDGLQHGAAYRVGLRQGLPSAVGEVLEAPVTLDIYVRDREPSIRFPGTGFVLPAAGPRGIPAVTVNTREAALSLYRVGDRSLVRTLGDGRFLQQLGTWEEERLTSDLGERVWQGTLETPFDLNQEVVTRFPLDEALPVRKPGVYVILGRARGDQGEDWGYLATQWFVVSNIGLFTFAAQDGLHVFARALDEALPAPGIGLQLVARNNEVLGETQTDDKGYARFQAGLSRGTAGLAPAALLGTGPNQDFVFLDLTRPGFDLADRGVAGRTAPGPMDVFLYTERGVYRPGETVHVQALVRDDTALALEGWPLTLAVRRPDGLEFARMIVPDRGLGGHWQTFQVPPNALRGTWTVSAHADPKADPIQVQRFLVEDFVPDRIGFELSLAQTIMPPGGEVSAEVIGHFLYGAPAANLRLDGELRISTTRRIPGLDGYVFGLEDEERLSMLIPLEDLPFTDEHGKAAFAARAEALPFATRPLEASVIIRMQEAGGRAVERVQTVPIGSHAPFIGIRPAFADDTVQEGARATFLVIGAGTDGTRTALGPLRWQLVKRERRYQWYRMGSAWEYEPVLLTTRVADGVLNVGTDEPARLEFPVDWGRYQLEIAEPGPAGPRTSYAFTAGWYVEARSTETPDGLEMALDKAQYSVGETATLTLSPRFSGQAQVVVGSERVVWQSSAFVPEEGIAIQIPVLPDFGPGAYVTAAVFRPGSNGNTRMPQRALGVQWLQVALAERELQVTLEAVSQMAPRQTLTVPLSVTGLGVDTEAYVAVAAVDVGILNLTAYQNPRPVDWYFGQRRLGMDIRDLYGQLIDANQGAAGRIRSGGDQISLRMQGSPPTEELVSFFSGPVKLDPGGKAFASFDMPQFQGTVRLMAIAWSREGLGQAASEVIVRDPVIMTPSLPQVLAPGDQSLLHLDLANLEGPAGDYDLTVQTLGPVLVGDDLPPKVSLAKGQRRSVTGTLTANALGKGEILIRLQHAEGLSLEQTAHLTVRAAQLPVTDQQIVTLEANGGTLRIDRDLFADRLAGSGRVTVGISRLAGLDVPSLLMGLDHYPYGCTEQLTSRTLPLLYLDHLARISGLPPQEGVEEKIQEAIQRILSFQSASGGFGLWGPGWGDLWLDAYVTDFLTRAREQKHPVPTEAFSLALQNLQNALSYELNPSEQGPQMAYALYVLARNRLARVGDLRYYADARIQDFATVLARAQLAAALGLYGESERVEKTFASAMELLRVGRDNLSREDYGSSLRDGAAMLALAAETRPRFSQLKALIAHVSHSRMKRLFLSTQESAWLVLAARALEAESGEDIQLQINGKAHSGNYALDLSEADLMTGPVDIVNRSTVDLDAVLTVSGTPRDPLAEGGQGFSIERAFYTLTGDRADISSVNQNQRFVAVITVEEEHALPSRVLVTDLLPAGFQIENPRLVHSADLSGFDWLPQVMAAHTEARTDRFVAAFDRRPDSDRAWVFAYLVRAVSPGSFVAPAAHVEDMYRPWFSARTAMGQMHVEGPRP